MDDIRPNVAEQSTRFVDQLRLTIRRRGLSYSTEKTYVHWVLRFIRQQGLKHPSTMREPEVEDFLADLAIRRRCSAATQRTALNALVFLYKHHLGNELGKLQFRFARRNKRMPTAFTHEEALAVIANLRGDIRLIASLMYGSGLRLSEALSLRVKDLDFSASQITVRDGKGGNERFTLFPKLVAEQMAQQVKSVEILHAYDLQCGYGEVFLPDALARKYPNASHSTAWQFVFPASQIAVDPTTGVLRRHHRHASSVQRAVSAAIRQSGFRRKASCHTFRHSFATRLVETGYDIKLVQSLMGHKDIRTTEIYLHIVRNRGNTIVSPMDQ